MENIELKNGEVLTITQDNGKTTKEVDLKLLDTSLLKLSYDGATNTVEMEITDTDLEDVPVLSGKLTEDTLHSFLKAITILSRQVSANAATVTTVAATTATEQ